MQHRTIRYIVFLTCTFYAFLFSSVKAQQSLTTEEKTLNVTSYIIFAEDAGRESLEVDSLFYLRSLPIVFSVGRADVDVNNRELQHFIRYAVPLINGDNVKNARIRIRSAASPDGPLALNQQLSKGRRDALLKIFEQNGVNASELQIDVVDEEYELLAFEMRQAGDPDAALVSRMVSKGLSDPAKLKKQLMNYDGGKLWLRIKEQYFPPLRASRFMIIFPENHAGDVMNLGIQPLSASGLDLRSYGVVFPDHLTLGKIFLDEVPQQPVMMTCDSVRREWLSLKTNLLQDVAYVPQYGFAPIWNVQLEYYPLKGHWTYGASLDIPWWQNRQKKHKYFQIRNWQIEARRYLFQESGSFRGWYAQAYLNAGKYGIGFTETKGWQGEGWGGGLGAGYVWRLGKKRDAVRLPDGQLWTDRHHWRLEAGIQVGYFRTKYDPYVYGDPVDRHYDDLYYYDWLGDAKDFRKRQYLFTWLGPTRIGLTLTYDILYRKQGKKGASR